LATPLGKEENQGTSTPLSIMSGGNKIPKPADISTDNIIKPSFDELSEEHRQAYEAYKKKRDEEDMNRYLANFNKDRLGNITAVGDITFPPLQSKELLFLIIISLRGTSLYANTFQKSSMLKIIHLFHLLVMLVRLLV
jgi:hypothetical protein